MLFRSLITHQYWQKVWTKSSQIFEKPQKTVIKAVLKSQKTYLHMVLSKVWNIHTKGLKIMLKARLRVFRQIFESNPKSSQISKWLKQNFCHQIWPKWLHTVKSGSTLSHFLQTKKSTMLRSRNRKGYLCYHNNWKLSLFVHCCF